MCHTTDWDWLTKREQHNYFKQVAHQTNRVDKLEFVSWFNKELKWYSSKSKWLITVRNINYMFFGICSTKNWFCHYGRAALRRCKPSGLTLNAHAFLVLDDEVLLVVLELAEIVLSVLGQQAKLLKSLVDLLVFLRHAVHHSTHWRVWLSITKYEIERPANRDRQLRNQN